HLTLTSPSADGCLGDRPQHNPDIENQRLMLKVPNIHPDALIERDPAAAVYLPPARNPRLAIEPPAVPRLVEFHFVGYMRPGPAHAQIPPQDIDELRHLVQASAPQELPDPGHAVVSRHLVYLLAGLQLPELFFLSG